MHRPHGRIPAIAFLVALGTVTSLALQAADDSPNSKTLPPPAEVEVEYAKHVKPLFAKYCFKCHGAEKRQSGLRLDVQADAVRGGDSGPAFEVGKSAESLLIKFVAGLDPELVMPPEGDKLSKDDVALLRAWIDQGAKWSDDGDAGGKGDPVHWSFRPLQQPAPPPVKDESRARNAVDRFVHSKLDSKKITPAPEANRRTLIRRLSLDLQGLPPTQADVEAFVGDTRPDAYELLVDRLLESPHFGERWGRHWLDL